MRTAVISAMLLLASHSAWTQEDKVPKSRLGSPAAATGFIGGESHDSYVLHAEKGRTLSVQVSWEVTGGNNAQFTVSESSNFFDGSPVRFGSQSDDGKRWSGKVPKTADYYIYVVAHPTAHYTLRETVH